MAISYHGDAVPFDLPLPNTLKAGGWKVKVFDREGSEEPHATVIHGRQLWRISLRTNAFLDARPPPRLVPRAVLDAVTAALDRLVSEWDARYPDNPVHGDEASDVT